MLYQMGSLCLEQLASIETNEIFVAMESFAFCEIRGTPRKHVLGDT